MFALSPKGHNVVQLGGVVFALTIQRWRSVPWWRTTLAHPVGFFEHVEWVYPLSGSPRCPPFDCTLSASLNSPAPRVLCPIPLAFTLPPGASLAARRAIQVRWPYCGKGTSAASAGAERCCSYLSMFLLHICFVGRFGFVQLKGRKNPAVSQSGPSALGQTMPIRRLGLGAPSHIIDRRCLITCNQSFELTC